MPWGIQTVLSPWPRKGECLAEIHPDGPPVVEAAQSQVRTALLPPAHEAVRDESSEIFGVWIDRVFAPRVTVGPNSHRSLEVVAGLSDESP